MAPVLFLFLMMAFAKTLEDEWTSLRLSKAQFSRKDNSPISNRQLVIHRPGTLSSGMLFDIFCMLYVDNGAFVFDPGLTSKKGSPSFPTTFPGLDLKYTPEQKQMRCCLHRSCRIYRIVFQMRRCRVGGSLIFRLILTSCPCVQIRLCLVPGSSTHFLVFWRRPSLRIEIVTGPCCILFLLTL